MFEYSEKCPAQFLLAQADLLRNQKIFNLLS